MKPNPFKSEKRRKELDRQKKAEEKARRRAERKPAGENGEEVAGETASSEQTAADS